VSGSGGGPVGTALESCYEKNRETAIRCGRLGGGHCEGAVSTFLDPRE